MFSRPVHQTIHLICLLLAAFFMPVSIWMLSAVSITLAVNWLISGDYSIKLRNLRTRNDMLILLLLFGMYLLWLLNTSDFSSATDELRQKLPLLYFPVIIGSSARPGIKQLRMVLLSFIAGCVVAVSAGFFALAGLLPMEVNDSRDLALFISSIRLSAMLNFGIFTALWLAADSETGSTVLRVALAAAAAAMTIFLFKLLSVTGLILFIFLLAGTGLYLALLKKQRIPGLIFAAAAAAVITASAIFLTSAWNMLHNPQVPEINTPGTTTPSGNHYTHYPEETLLENGYLVWMNVCEDELRKEWNNRSKLPYDGNDHTGNELRVTLIRYITFLGMPKDSSAVASLTADDISNIEKGFANPLYARPASPRAKAYELAWQLDRALKGANPSGHSVAQRLEFYRAAAGIIKKHLWFGTGTGDVSQALIDEYNLNNTPLTKEYRLRAHNQYLTFAITFGVPGMIIALALMLIPWLRSPNRSLYPFVLFISVFFILMFNDDSFHSFPVAAFFSYFYTTLLLFENRHET